jgi:hypothetical protein
MVRWVSLSEASRILKTPETTLRRMAVEGKIVAEREPRAPGDTRTVWRIRVDDPPDDPPPSATPEGDQPPSASESTPATTERALAILDTVLRANVETMDRQAAQIDQYSELLRQETERRVRAEARADHLAEEAARLRAEAARRRWWRWW